MDQEILEKLKDQEQKLEKIYDSVDKLKRYFLWTLIITVVTIVLPIIGIIIILPWFIKVITSAYSLE